MGGGSCGEGWRVRMWMTKVLTRWGLDSARAVGSVMLFVECGLSGGCRGEGVSCG